MINYIQGDLFKSVAEIDDFIIPHVVNNKGAWGAGFVVPLGKIFPESRERYMKFFPAVDENDLLGETSIVNIKSKKSSCVANMFAQTLGTKRPLFYNKLVNCMDFVGDVAHVSKYEIHAPKFGSNLAGGNWDFIEQLIIDCWIKRNLKVNIYYL